MVDGYIGQRMFLCTICSLEYFCTNRQPNICAQMVGEYLLENILVDHLLSVCTQTVDECFGRPFVHKRLTHISERKRKENSMRIKNITL